MERPKWLDLENLLDITEEPEAKPQILHGRPVGYTTPMTTSISVPDPVFQEAEQLAERLEKTLSQLYTEALIEYLARRNPDTITERLNTVWDSVSEPEDRFVTETAQDVLRRVEW